MTQFAIPGDAELICAEVSDLKQGGGPRHLNASTRGNNKPH